MKKKIAETDSYQPLATRLRPRVIDEFFGQQHLVAKGKPLRKAIENKHLHSMILWGPAGSGKTTLARLLAASANAHVEKISAVLSGVKDIRTVIDRAHEIRKTKNQDTVLFVDEVHRFNKAQQDAFLPYVEDGTLILIGATTENPSFELNNALLSRTRVYVLKQLEEEDILKIIDHALKDKERGLGNRNLEISIELKKQISHFADGDARQALNILEILSDFAIEKNKKAVVTEDMLKQVFSGNVRRFDKQNDIFYEQISALHKAVRGSSPDASLYWFARMIDGGCDPEYIVRRVVRMASEDIGNADPNALHLALAAWDTYQRLGTPEGELAIAQAIVYLACAPKSNAVYTAWSAAIQDVEKYGSLEVPMHIRNAPTGLMKRLGYGKNYRYAHDEPEAYAAGESYFPEKIGEKQYYFPVERGLEIKIKEKLEHLRKLGREKKN